MNIRLRLMTSDDIPDAMRLKEIAGWNQTIADWRRFLSVGPQGCFVAEHDGRAIGTVTTIVYENRFAWIAQLLVDPEYRGRGIGTQLLEQAIGYLDSQNLACMKLDATPLGKPLYEKLGFATEYELERWMLKRRVGEQAAQDKDTRIDAVLSLDREIFGADRSQLLRSLAEEAPEFALAARRNGAIVGYTFARHGALADQLGPWMANNEDVAAELLDEFLRRSGRELLFVDCMLNNPWALGLVKARGFEFSRPLTRMFRGTNKYPGQPELLCASLGPEFG
jgi:ribosomal protein S18 acetylase RimI-like enzyme